MTTDIEAIVNASKKFSESEFVLFGGEPFMLDADSLKMLFSKIAISSVSTNLLKLDKYKLQLLKDNQTSIATSWNPSRFTEQQYLSWLDKVQMAINAKLHVTVLITLTYDLFSSRICDVLQDLCKYDTTYFDGVKFEPYVKSTADLVEAADKWLVDLYSNWKYQYKNIIADEYKVGNMHLCKNIWTIQPNGNIVHSCPAVERDNILYNCLKCKYNKVCRPCMKQDVCTFFKKLYQKVKSNEHDSR